MTNSYPAWDEWLAGLGEDERAEALAQVGAVQPLMGQSGGRGFAME